MLVWDDTAYAQDVSRMYILRDQGVFIAACKRLTMSANYFAATCMIDHNSAALDQDPSNEGRCLRIQSFVACILPLAIY